VRAIIRASAKKKKFEQEKKADQHSKEHIIYELQSTIPSSLASSSSSSPSASSLTTLAIAAAAAAAAATATDTDELPTTPNSSRSEDQPKRQKIHHHLDDETLDWVHPAADNSESHPHAAEDFKVGPIPRPPITLGEVFLT